MSISDGLKAQEDELREAEYVRCEWQKWKQAESVGDVGTRIISSIQTPLLCQLLSTTASQS